LGGRRIIKKKIDYLLALFRADAVAPFLQALGDCVPLADLRAQLAQGQLLPECKRIFQPRAGQPGRGLLPSLGRRSLDPPAISWSHQHDRSFRPTVYWISG